MKNVYPLKIERSKDGFWGHTKIDDQLLVDFAFNLKDLRYKMKILMYESCSIDPCSIQFRCKDISLS